MLFIPLQKVDAARRVIVARLDETPDRAGMILDYASSKAAFIEWSETMQKASGGQSFGNVREMHGLKAAGRVIRLDCLDDEKAFVFEIEVIDDDTMLKVETGVLTGISQGGKYGRKWRDGPHTRYTAGKINEMSLVDLPCNPGGAVMLKADGTEIAHEFADGGIDAQVRYVSSLLIDAEDLAEYRQILIAQPADMLKAIFPDGGPDNMQKRDFSADERAELATKGEAMKDGSFPIADRADLENAVEAYGRAGDKDAAKNWITERAHALAATDLLPPNWAIATIEPDNMQKGLGNVSRLAELLECLGWLVSDATWEAGAERDGSKIPANLVAWVKQGAMILTAMTAEETAQAMASLQAQVDAIPMTADMQKALLADDMLKVGARNSQADLSTIQAIHDHAASLGACCSGAGDDQATMVKAAGEMAGIRAQLADALTAKDDMQKRYDALLAMPVGGGPARTDVGNLIVSKGGDISLAPEDKARMEAKAVREAEIAAMPDGPEKLAALVRQAMTS